VAGEPFEFGSIVRVADNPQTRERRIAGGVGMVVAVGVPSGSDLGDVVGVTPREQLVHVSLEEPREEVVLIAPALLEATGEVSELEIVDGLADHRSGHEATVAADLVRVRVTAETERLGLAGLVGEVMGETIPSSSGVSEVVGGGEEDYAINAWFEERQEQFWFAPGLLEPFGAG
jgi:hypothetical protein